MEHIATDEVDFRDAYVGATCSCLLHALKASLSPCRPLVCKSRCGTVDMNIFILPTATEPSEGRLVRVSRLCVRLFHRLVIYLNI